MQVRTKKDLYDTLRMIKGTSRDIDGFRGISRAKTVDWNLIKTSRDVEGSQRKIQRTSKFTKSSWVIRGMSRNVEGKEEKLQRQKSRC